MAFSLFKIVALFLLVSVASGTQISMSAAAKTCGLPTTDCKVQEQALMDVLRKFAGRYSSLKDAAAVIPVKVDLCHTDFPIVSGCIDRYVKDCGKVDPSVTSAIVNNWNAGKSKLTAVCMQG